MEEKRYFYDRLRSKKGVIIFAIISLVIIAIIVWIILAHSLSLAKIYTDNCYEEIRAISEAISNGHSINEIENIRTPGKFELIKVTKVGKGEWMYGFSYNRDEISDFYFVPNQVPTYYLTFDSNGKLIDSSFDISSREALLKYLSKGIYLDITMFALGEMVFFLIVYLLICESAKDSKEQDKKLKALMSK